MGNLSWFPEGQIHDAGRRFEDTNIVQIFASYRHRAAYGGRDGDYLLCSINIFARSLLDICSMGLHIAEIKDGGIPNFHTQ